MTQYVKYFSNVFYADIEQKIEEFIDQGYEIVSLSHQWNFDLRSVNMIIIYKDDGEEPDK